MVFWGIEVKPGKPYTHEPNGSRLHISQATLGIGVATNKSTVQCNVGDASPVFICSLFPGKEESAQINLEFEEAHQVIFSVLGVRSVHLTGYYLGKGREIDDDLESYGEDIADTETDISEDDDQYEDSFINDGDVEFLPPSPMPNKSEKEKPNHKKARKGKYHRRRLRKKHEKSKSDKVNSLPQQNSEALLLESDEEDFFVSSLLKKKSSAKDSEINVPVVVMETTLDVVKKKRKQDGSTAVKSSESLSPTVVGGESGSTAKKMKSKLHTVEGEMQNQAWQEDKEPKADDPSKKSSAVEVEEVPSGENCKKSKKKKKKDDSLPHQNPEAQSSIPNGEDFFVSSPLKKKSSAKDSETKIPDVVMVTPLDVAKKKQKQDGSTAVKSSERLSPSVVEGEPGSTAKKMKSKLHIVEGEMQNQTWQEDKEPKADDPSKKSTAVEVEQVPNGENCKKSKTKKEKDDSLPHQNSEARSSIPDGEDFFVSSPLKKKSSAKDSETKFPDVIIETPLDVAEKKQKQDGSTAVNSSESLSPSVVDGEPGSTAKKMKSKLHIVEGETQNQAWQEDKEPTADDPSKKSSSVEVEEVPSGENCKKSEKKKKKDDSLPHQNPEARSSEPDGEDFFVSSPLKKKSSAKDSETKIPDVVIETPLDVAKKKQKRDGSIAVKSSERLSASVVDGEPGSTAKKMRRKLHIMEGEMQNQAWQEDKKPKADDPSKKSSAVEVEQVPSRENCKKSKKKKEKDDSLPHHNPEARSSEPDGEDFFVSSPLKKKSSAKDSETKIPYVFIETPLDVAENKQKQDGSTAVNSSESLSPSVVDGEPGSSVKKMKRKLQFVEEEMQNQAWQEDKEPKADDPTQKSSAVEEQLLSGENCKKSKRKKRKSKLPNGKERRMRNLSLSIR